MKPHCPCCQSEDIKILTKDRWDCLRCGARRDGDFWEWRNEWTPKKEEP